MKTLSNIPLNFKIKASTISIFIIAFILLAATYFDNPKDFAFTLIICLLGSILGWLVAMLVTPYGQTDATNLKSFSKIIGSFLTGYVLSKLDKVFETFVNEKQYADKLTIIRLMLFISFFFLFWILVFSYRTYVIIDPTDLSSKNEEKISQLNKWKDLLDKELITKDDYDIEKTKILQV
jgi:hypothetical protein